MLTRVVCLPKRAKQARSRRGADQPSILLFPEVWPCGMRALVCSIDVDSVDQIPVRLLHILEADIAQDAGIVDEDIDAAEGVDGCLDDGFPVLDRVVVGDRFAACGADGVDDFVCRLRAGVSWCSFIVSEACETRGMPQCGKHQDRASVWYTHGKLWYDNA
jgi:hypothetical protein